MEARELFEQAGAKTVFDESYTGACVQKWGKMLGGIEDTHLKKNTAVLLENELQHLKSFNEDTLSTNAGAFTKYVFPILRRVFPNLIANQLVSVQPMTSPVSGIFYYEKKYEDRKGTKIPQTPIADLPTAMGYDGELAAGDNLNQNFAKYYSSEFVDYDVVCTDTGTSTDALTQAGTNCRGAAWSPIRDNGTVGQRTFYVKAYYRFVDPDAASAPTEAIATMDASGNLIDNTATGNTVGTFTIATGAWAIDPVGSGGTAAGALFVDNTVIYLQYFVNWELVGQTSGAEIPSIGLDITLSTVQAESRKLKARWSVEAMDDLKALHGLDAETEFVSTFSNEVLLETDREIITDLVNNAGHTAAYTYSSTVPGEVESIRQLLTQISAVSARIHKTTTRAPANFLVVSTAVGGLLDQLSTHGDFASIEQNIQSPSYGPVTANFGITRIGTLLRKYAVYQDPYMADGQILVGLKGNSFLDAGYVYAPYVPLQLTPTFMDPNDFTFRKGVRTRYATKMLRPEYYGVINVSGLPSVTTSL